MKFEKRIKYGQYTVIFITVTGFLIFVTVGIVSDQKEILPFGDVNSRQAKILEYSVDAGFLTLFLLMIGLNIDLFRQIRRKNKLLGD